MKITKSQLKRIIKEEMSKILDEATGDLTPEALTNLQDLLKSGLLTPEEYKAELAKLQDPEGAAAAAKKPLVPEPKTAMDKIRHRMKSGQSYHQE